MNHPEEGLDPSPPTRLKVEVTAAHIEQSRAIVQRMRLKTAAKAIGNPPHCCPVALALHGAGVVSPLVTRYSIDGWLPDDGREGAAYLQGRYRMFQVETPSDVATRVATWDRERVMEPFDFELEIR